MNLPPYRPLELMEDPNITKFECTDFIGVWENFVPGAFCDDLISHFEKQLKATCLYEGYDDEDSPPGKIQHRITGVEEGIMDGSKQFNSFGNMGRADTSLLINYSSYTLSHQVNQFLHSCVTHYASKFSQLRHSPLVSTDIKMQRTNPGGGYHMWHYENSTWNYAQRELVWMIYLNDMPDGEAETEFLYQKRRFKPTKGTVVIWPAGMTHVHKGNTVFTQDKYIITGWYIRIPTGG